MQPRDPLLKRTIERLRHYRYKWFAKGPSPREWEERLQRVVAETVAQSLPWIPERGGSFLDVGANVGVYAEHVLRARPDARAWLFEPVREHWERCSARFAGRPGVVVERFALGDAAGRTTIWKPKHNPGGNVIEPEIVAVRRDHMDFRPEEIECRVFDEYSREHGIERVDLVKTDTEGFDYRVLRGMLGFLERCRPRPVIVAELLAEGVHPDYPAQLAVLEELYRLGYERVDISKMTYVEDFLFVPRDRR